MFEVKYNMSMFVWSSVVDLQQQLTEHTTNYAKCIEDRKMIKSQGELNIVFLLFKYNERHL